jgi:hypothetical protein
MDRPSLRRFVNAQNDKCEADATTDVRLDGP